MSLALPQFPGLAAVSPSAHPELLAAPTMTALTAWLAARPDLAPAIGVAAIDPDLADTADLTRAYGLDTAASVNCVIVVGRREGVERVAAVAVRADTRADINHTVKRELNVRKASFMAMAEAVERSGMEYGGITPLGLPEGWRLLVDQGVVNRGPAIIGSGLRASKLILPGEALATLPGAEIIENLGL
jgi:prolyl-tRNA editing enzyme YbaK/EbsC (Cys-tRNA(Pro) deacylase)